MRRDVIWFSNECFCEKQDMEEGAILEFAFSIFCMWII